MDQILVYADSLSWGLIPDTRKRLAFDKRWPGLLECCLNKSGRRVRMIENCLNGRRTDKCDPGKHGRDGSAFLSQALEINAPLKLVIIMLGTNDFQKIHECDAQQSSRGIEKLIDLVRQAPIEPGMPTPETLVIAPPQITQAKGLMAEKFAGAVKRNQGFNAALKHLAKEKSVYFFDADELVDLSAVDGIHLDQEAHEILGQALAQKILSEPWVSID